MKTSAQVSTGSGSKQTSGTPGSNASKEKSGSWKDESAPLPHETDQQSGSQHEDAPRNIGKQAHRDLERGLKDTDRRGGDDYQQHTQNDGHANENATGKD